LQTAALLALVRDLLIDPQPFFALFAARRAQLAKFFHELFPSNQPLALADWLRDSEYPALADAVEAQDAQFAAQMRKQWEMLDALRAPSGAALPESEMERLHALVMLAERCGIQRICVFVDGVDKPVEQNKPQDALNQILPLCHSLQLLDEMGLAVQFFLPQELATPMSDNGVRFDRYIRYDLDWTDEQLTELLRQRLEIVTDGKISSLGQLAAEEGAKENQETNTKQQTSKKQNKPPLAQRLDSEVVKHAHGSPRQLIRVADALFEAYYARTPREGVFIQDDLDKAVAIVKDTLKRDSLVPPLVIDENLGRVLVGEREIKLSAKELQCLILLKQKKGETLSRDKIWQELYGETNPSASQTDPFFSRLRKKLERDSEHPDYLITDRGRGFHLENVGE
jgi:two-component system KDP operon response regulator KdpE